MTATRGAGDPKPLSLTPNIGSVRLIIDTPPHDYADLRATLSTVDGDEVWSERRRTTAPAGKRGRIRLTLPARLFTTQDYTLRLFGLTPAKELETISQYYFRVNKSMN